MYVVPLLTYVVSLLAYAVSLLTYILCGSGRRITSLYSLPPLSRVSLDIRCISFDICYVSFDVYFVWLRATNNESLCASASFARLFPGLALSLCLSLFPSFFSRSVSLSLSFFSLARACARSLTPSLFQSLSLFPRFPSIVFPLSLSLSSFVPPLSLFLSLPHKSERGTNHTWFLTIGGAWEHLVRVFRMYLQYQHVPSDQ